MGGDLAARDAVERLVDVAVLWRAGACEPWDVVLAACEALACGAEADGLALVAALGRQEAVTELDRWLPDALREVGRTPPTTQSGERDEIVRAFARAVLRGDEAPRAAVRVLHRLLGHDHPLGEGFAELDDAYDIGGYAQPGSTVTPGYEDALDAEVLAEARRVLGRP